MLYEITLTDTETSTRTTIEQDWGGDSQEHVIFYWAEHNFACDCNRSSYFPDLDLPCDSGDPRIKIEIKVKGETIYKEHIK